MLGVKVVWCQSCWLPSEICTIGCVDLYGRQERTNTLLGELIVARRGPEACRVKGLQKNFTAPVLMQNAHGEPTVCLNVQGIGLRRLVQKLRLRRFCTAWMRTCMNHTSGTEKPFGFKIFIGSKRLQRAYTGAVRVNRLLARSNTKHLAGCLPK